MKTKPYLREVQLSRDSISMPHRYPFDIPAIQSLSSLRLHEDVTFIVGENGSGKSTLIEAIALGLGFGIEGGTKSMQQYSTHHNASSLVDHLKLIKGYKQPQDHYFLRAESFYNVATYMDELKDPKYLEPYGGPLHTRSHGEIFLAVLTQKLRGNGLYIFDEPEAALSPNRQLAALVAIDQLVQNNSQLIIATHSPILLSYPHAIIYQFDENGINKVNYEDTAHYQVSKLFLNDYKQMLKALLA